MALKHGKIHVIGGAIQWTPNSAVVFNDVVVLKVDFARIINSYNDDQLFDVVVHPLNDIWPNATEEKANLESLILLFSILDTRFLTKNVPCNTNRVVLYSAH